MMGKLALAALAAVLAAHSGSGLAQPSGGGPVRVVRTGEPQTADMDGAREFVAIMYHGDEDADTADWLAERLMDRYRRAFDLFDGADDPAVRAAVADMLKSLPARIRRIVDPRIPTLRAGAIRTFAMQWRGDDMRTLVAFARTPAGKRYVEAFPMLDERNIFLRPALAPLLHDNADLASAVAGEMSSRLGARFAGNPDYAKAIIAAGAGI